MSLSEVCDRIRMSLRYYVLMLRLACIYYKYYNYPLWSKEVKYKQKEVWRGQDDQMKTLFFDCCFKLSKTKFPFRGTPFLRKRSSQRSSLSVLVDRLLIDFLLSIREFNVFCWTSIYLLIRILLFSAFFKERSIILFASSFEPSIACCLFLSTLSFCTIRWLLCPFISDSIDSLLKKWCIRFW